jgi:hypothetical protein
MIVEFGFNRTMLIADNIANQVNDDYDSVRRPTRGTVLKPDTYATLRLVTRDNKPLAMIDGGSNRKVGKGGKEFFEVNGKRYTDIYSNFLIQSVQEDRAEKAQILETFGEAFLFLFGERARMLNISGVLLNTFDFNWKQEWLENYHRYLRGTSCVENDAQVFLAYDKTLVSGYLLSTSVVTQAQEENFVQFNFQMFVTNYTSLGDVGSPYASPDGTQGNNEFSLSFGELAALRPELIGAPSGTTALAGTKSFIQSLQDGILLVNNAINTAKKYVNGFLLDVNALLNGDIVRVPYGFAGSLVFEDSQLTNRQLSQLSAMETLSSNRQSSYTVKYTTFDRNEDEYVGISQHYGSSVQGDVGEGGIVRYRWTVAAEEEKKNSAIVRKATAQWAAAGLKPPTDWDSPLARFMIKKTIGLITAGVTKGWQSGSVIEGLKAAGVKAAFGSGSFIGAISGAAVRLTNGNNPSQPAPQAPASASTVRQVVVPPRSPSSGRTVTP